MTPTVVVDSSVIIDLHRADLLDKLFKLPAQYMVPDIMYSDELEGWFGETLMANGLIIQPLDESEVGSALDLLRQCSSLSLPDAFALALAAKRKLTMLAGAKDMRELGTGLGIEVRGVLHVFDLLEQSQMLSPASLHTCLTLLCKSRRVRLPQEEIDVRIERYTIAWPEKG